jgi:hypothetical protein
VSRDIGDAYGLTLDYQIWLEALDATKKLEKAQALAKLVTERAKKAPHQFNPHYTDRGQYGYYDEMCIFCGAFERSEICVEK